VRKRGYYVKAKKAISEIDSVDSDDMSRLKLAVTLQLRVDNCFDVS
jgi:hypothetical protein